MRKPEHHTNPDLLQELQVPSFQEGDLLPDPPPPAGGGLEIHLLLEDGFAAYLLWVIVQDLVFAWSPDRPCKLTREEVIVFALFLHDQLPEKFRTPVPPLLSGSPTKRAA